jgi:hypothetical protein
VSEQQSDAIFWSAAVAQPAVFLVIGLVLAARRRRG